MKSLFDEAAYKEVLNRIDELRPESSGYWGQMDVAQMLCHCQNPLALALKRLPALKQNWAMKQVFRLFRASLYNDKPWKKNLPTPSDFKVTSPKEFNEEKEKLLELVAAFHEEKVKTSWDSHPSFGAFTHEQWGKMQYKHLDHHLQQFGV
jgi:hypothetical protein